MALKKKVSKKDRIQSPYKGPKGDTAEAGADREPEVSDEISDLRRRL